jgi:hypothetical protein
MNARTPSAPTMLDELEARQDEVLVQLEALNARLEQVLAEFAPAKSSPASRGAGQREPARS